MKLYFKYLPTRVMGIRKKVKNCCDSIFNIKSIGVAVVNFFIIINSSTTSWWTALVDSQFFMFYLKNNDEHPMMNIPFLAVHLIAKKITYSWYKWRNKMLWVYFKSLLLYVVAIHFCSYIVPFQSLFAILFSQKEHFLLNVWAM